MTFLSYEEYEDRNAKIVARIKTGDTLESIGASYGLSRERVRQIGNANGVRSVRWFEIGNPFAQLTAEQRERVSALFLREMPLDHIATSVGVSLKAVRHLAETKHGYVAHHDDEEWTPGEVAFLRSHYKQPNWSMSKIGRALGRTRNEVAGKSRRLGLQKPIDFAATKSSQIRLLREKGERPSQIAKTVGASVATVNSVLWQDANRARHRTNSRNSYARHGSV